MKKYLEWETEMEQKEGLPAELKYISSFAAPSYNILSEIKSQYVQEFGCAYVQFLEIKQALFESNLNTIFKDSSLTKSVQQYDKLFLEFDIDYGAPPKELCTLENFINKKIATLTRDFILLNKESKALQINKPSLEKIFFKSSKQENKLLSLAVSPKKIFLFETLDAIMLKWFPASIFKLILQYCFTTESKVQAFLSHYQLFIDIWLKKSLAFNPYRNTRIFDISNFLETYITIVNSLIKDPTAETALKDFQTKEHVAILKKPINDSMLGKFTLRAFLQGSKTYLNKQEFACAQSLIGDSLVLTDSHIMLYGLLNQTYQALLDKAISKFDSARKIPIISIKLSNNLCRIYVEKSKLADLLIMEKEYFGTLPKSDKR